MNVSFLQVSQHWWTQVSESIEEFHLWVRPYLYNRSIYVLFIVLEKFMRWQVSGHTVGVQLIFFFNLKVTQMKVQRSWILEIMRYEFELGHNAAEATKNIYAKSKGIVDHSNQRVKDLSLGLKKILKKHIKLSLGWPNVQRELNPFLFQAELPPLFWPLLFWVLVWRCENGTRSRVAARTKDDFKSGKTNVELIYLFPRELGNTAQPILINVLRSIKMCLSL